jgi:hypothetical protein
VPSKRREFTPDEIQARRFAAYRVVCRECAPLWIHKPSAQSIRMATSPGQGSLIFHAMHETVCEHQHPMPWEFERAAALHNVVHGVGYVGRAGNTSPTPNELAEYILTNEAVFVELAERAVQNATRLMIRNQVAQEPVVDPRIELKEFVRRIRRADPAPAWLYRESDKWIQRDESIRQSVGLQINPAPHLREREEAESRKFSLGSIPRNLANAVQ